MADLTIGRLVYLVGIADAALPQLKNDLNALEKNLKLNIGAKFDAGSVTREAAKATQILGDLEASGNKRREDGAQQLAAAKKRADAEYISFWREALKLQEAEEKRSAAARVQAEREAAAAITAANKASSDAGKVSAKASSDAIALLSREINGLRNQYQATGQNADGFAKRLTELRNEALGNAAAFKAGSAEFLRYSQAAAQAERTITGIQGGISRLGVGQQVTQALSGNFAQLVSTITPLGGQINTVSTAFSALGGGAAAGGAGISAAGLAVGGTAIAVLGLGAAVSSAIKTGIPEVRSLEKSFNILSANGTSNIEAVTRSVTELQQTTGLAAQSFTKSQLTDALAQTVKAGVASSDALTLLATSTKLAAAEGTNLNESTGLVLQNLRQFDLDTTQAARAGDALATAGNLAAGSAKDLSVGLATVGPVAKNAGFTLEETLGLLVNLDNKGLKAAQEGATGLRSVLAQLAKPSKEALTQISELGISLETFTKVPVRERLILVRDAIQGSGKDLSEFARIADTQALTALLALDKSTDEYTAKINNSRGSLEKYSQQMSQGNEAAARRFDVAIKDLSATFTTTITPALTTAADALGNFLRLLDPKNVQINGLKLLEGQASSIRSEIARLEKAGGIEAALKLPNAKAALAQLEQQIRALRASTATTPAVSTGERFGPPAPKPAAPSSSSTGGKTPAATDFAALEAQLKALIKLEVQGKLTGAALESNLKAQDALQKRYKDAKGDVDALSKSLQAYEAGLKSQASADQNAAREAKQAAEERERERKRAAEEAKRFADQLDDANRKFRAGLKDGKLESSGLQAFQQQIVSIKDAARDAGVALPRAFLSAADALEKQGAALIANNKLLAEQKRLGDDLDKANAIRAQEAAKAAKETFKNVLLELDDDQLASKIAANNKAINNAQFTFDNAKTEAGTRVALEKLNALRERGALLEGEVTRRIIESNAASDAGRDALEEGYQLETERVRALAETRAQIATDQRVAAEAAQDESDAFATSVESAQSLREDIAAILGDTTATNGNVEDLQRLLDANNAILNGDRDLSEEQKQLLLDQNAALKDRIAIYKQIALEAARNTAEIVAQIEAEIADSVAGSEGNTRAATLSDDARVNSEDAQDLVDLEQEILELRESGNKLSAESNRLLDAQLERLRFRKSILEATAPDPITPFANPVSGLPSADAQSSSARLDQPRLAPTATPAQRALLEAEYTPRLKELQGALEALNAEFERGAIAPEEYLSRVGPLQAAAAELSPTLTALGISQTGLTNALELSFDSISSAADQLAALEDDANNASEATGRLEGDTITFTNATEDAALEIAALGRAFKIGTLNGESLEDLLEAQILELEQALFSVEQNSDAWILYAEALAAAQKALEELRGKQAESKDKEATEGKQQAQEQQKQLEGQVKTYLSIGAAVTKLIRGLTDVAQLSGSAADKLRAAQELAASTIATTADIFGAAVGLPFLGDIARGLNDIVTAIADGLNALFDPLKAQVNALSKSLQSSIAGAITSGIVDAYQSGEPEKFSENFASSVGKILFQALVKTFVDAVIVQGILKPALDSYSRALLTDDPNDDAVAQAEVDKAIGKARGAYEKAAPFLQGAADRLDITGGSSSDTKTSSKPSIALNGSVPSATIQTAIGTDYLKSLQLFDSSTQRFDISVTRFGAHTERFGQIIDKLLQGSGNGAARFS